MACVVDDNPEHLMIFVANIAKHHGRSIIESQDILFGFIEDENNCAYLALQNLEISADKLDSSISKMTLESEKESSQFPGYSEMAIHILRGKPTPDKNCTSDKMLARLLELPGCNAFLLLKNILQVKDDQSLAGEITDELALVVGS